MADLDFLDRSLGHRVGSEDFQILFDLGVGNFLDRVDDPMKTGSDVRSRSRLGVPADSRVHELRVVLLGLGEASEAGKLACQLTSSETSR